jgi:hypothetical protein
VTEWVSDVDLGAALLDLGSHVAVPEHSLWPRVRAELDERGAPHSAWPLWVVVAAAIAVIALAVVSIAPARHAVADLLGIGATEVQHVDRLPAAETTRPLPTNGDVSRQLARAHLFEPSTALAGDPVAGRIDPAGETVVAYENVVLSQRPVAGAVPSIKRYAGEANVQFVKVGDLPAIYVGGEHTRTIDGHTFRSGNALIWENDGFELRLEGDLPLNEMLAVARSVTRAR